MNDGPIEALGNLPAFRYPEERSHLIDLHKAGYRERHGLPPDAEVVWLDGPDGTAYLYLPGSFVRLEGGELTVGEWSAARRWRRVRRAWDWARYGWRSG